MDGRIYTAGDIRKLTGLSYQEQDRLTRAGVITPTILSASGKGTRRLYAHQDVVALRLRQRMRDGTHRCVATVDELLAGPSVSTLKAGDFVIASCDGAVVQRAQDLHLEELLGHDGVVTLVSLDTIRRDLDAG